MDTTQATDSDYRTEDADGKEYQWRSLDEFAISTAEDDNNRNVAEVLEVNRIVRYFTKLLFKEKVDIEQKEELASLAHLKKHVKLFKEGTFSWEVIFDSMDGILTFIKPTFSKFSSTIDFELMDHRLFQKLFPIQLIYQYLKVVNRTYGKPVYDKALRFQTNLLETFLWHHLEADTCFYPKITTADINLTDPFMRIKIRDRNRNDSKLLAKYFNRDFDLKEFTSTLLDLYFPNVTWRYIGASQEMHRWSLLLLLRQFELGLFKAEEMHEMLNLLLQKLENLLVLEKRSYKDFTTTLVNYPRFIETLKAYFYECKEIVASICIQIVVLLNDHDFSRNHPLYSGKTITSDVPDTQWQGAYFADTSISNYINRIMTTYLLQFNNTAENSQKESLFAMLNELIKLSTANTTDLYTESADIVDQSLLSFYSAEMDKCDLDEVDSIKQEAIDLVVLVTRENDQMQRAEMENCLMSGLKNILVRVGQRKSRPNSANFMHMLGFEGIPNIVLALQNGILELKLSKEVEKLVGLALIVICQDSKLNQISILSKASMKHWDLMFNCNPMVAVVLQTSIFGQDYRIYFSHHSAMSNIFSHFSKALDRVVKLGGTENKKYDEWLQALCLDSEITANMDNLVIFYSYCRFIAGLLSHQDQNFEKRFFNFEIQRILGPDFFQYFMPIVTSKDFIDKDTFTPVLEVSSTAELTSFVSKCGDNSMLESHVKGAVFEVAMLTMKLLNKACSGLYLYHMYRLDIKPVVDTVMVNTAHLCDFRDNGMLYRSYVVDFISHFKVFPNNGVLTFRNVEFQESNPINRESRVLVNHLDGSLLKEIVAEFKGLGIHLDHACETASETSLNNFKTYYFGSLLPMLYKYCNGLYTTYTQTTEANTLMEELLALKDTLESTQVFVNGRSLSFSSLVAMDTLSPYKRLPDIEERLYPAMSVIRDTLSIVLIMIETIYDRNSDDKIAIAAHNLLRERYQRESAIFSTPQNLEPWRRRKSRKAQAAQESEEMQVFRGMINEYKNQKLNALDKPDDSNILTKFLQSEADYIPNMITFLDRLIERNFSKLSTAVPESTKDAFENMDYLVSTFLEKDILFTVIKFFSKVLKSCQSVRDGFYQNAEDVKSASRFSLTITYACLGLMSQLACNKTFIDSEYDLIEERVGVLSDFFQYLCFGGSKDTKNLLGNFVPSTPGLPHTNKAKKSLFYDCYVRTETQLGGFNVWSNSASHFLVSDRPEYLKQIMNLLKIVTECCAGPCNENQNQIYIFRSDMYTGIIRRSVDYVDSSLYTVKNKVIDYVAALIEGDDKAIVSHFAGNITFDELFALICNSVKRLVVYMAIKNDSSRHQKLMKKIAESHEKVQRSKQAEDEAMKITREDDLEFYLEDILATNKGAINPTINMSPDPINAAEQIKFDDPRVVTQDMMDQFEIDSYEQIMTLYDTDPEFASHPLMIIAQKLNEFLNKFIKYVPGYRFSLQNVYSKMAQRFGNKTPQYILNRITTMGQKTTGKAEENVEIYMFMCKVSEEIKRWNYVTKSEVVIMFPVAPAHYVTKELLSSNVSKEAILEVDVEMSGDAESAANTHFEIFYKLGQQLRAKHSKDRSLFEEYLVKHYEMTARHHSTMFVQYTKSQHPLETSHFQTSVIEGIAELKATLAKLNDRVEQLEAKTEKK